MESKSNINLHNLALGSSSSTSEMINYENSCLNSLLYLNKRKEENIFHYYNEIKKELVNVETLDNWITQNEVHHIHLLKIDTQGYDFEVLKGSRRCLKQGLIDCIAIEINFIKMSITSKYLEYFLSLGQSLGSQNNHPLRMN